MKNWSRAFAILCLLYSPVMGWAGEPSSNGGGEESSWVYQVGKKFMRGTTNFVTGWVEVPKQIYLVGRNEGWVTGAIRGPIDGLGWFIARTVGGAYEVLTFPFPLPLKYQPMFTPEYVWQPVLPEPVLPTSGLAASGPAPSADGGPNAPTSPLQQP
ncbi:MAG: exosortase system-associated protein, TIGR04073 family [Nitrospirae bacterium]|nr:exosortase system-associated protein, TIGR04073 family [Nitrospirota bacterium]